MAAGYGLVAACPDCTVGRVARGEVWNQDFGENLLVVLVPFVVVGLVARWAERARW